MLYALLDRLAERYGEGEHKLEAMRAREEYFDRAGKVFDDDAELFEGRMASFLEWYVLERPSAGTDAPPVVRAIEESARVHLGRNPQTGSAPPAMGSVEQSSTSPDANGSTSPDADRSTSPDADRSTSADADRSTSPDAKGPLAHTPEERQVLADLAVSHRSLFELAGEVGEAGRELELEDVIGGARFTVQERRSTVGIAPGDLFEARLIWDGRSVVFGRTFLFHPPDAREVVLDWVERAVADGTSRADILFHLSRQHVRWHRLGHVGAAKVYRDA
jgi:hypothetical protein